MLLLFSESGSYALLERAPDRPWFSARMFTGYHRTSGLCIGFAYAFITENNATVRVLAIKEDKSEVIIGNRTLPTTMTYNYYGLWMHFLAELPDGINMIMIEGQRGDDGDSGLALDDIEVQPCHQFRGKVPLLSLILLCTLNVCQYTRESF